MRKSILLIAFLLLVSSSMLKAQYKHFTTQGVIEFEKTANMHALFKKQINKDNESYMQQAYDQYIKDKPQFKRLKSTLTFSNNLTLFTPVEDENEGNSFGNEVAVSQNSTTFSNFVTSTAVSQKKVFEETFLLKDSVRKMKWKITDERREIAGYSCRRANGLVLDSIYVVAFYTDEIPTPGGPESFNGLPGMILGVALPHENMTWFATKVTDQVLLPNAIRQPAKGKPVNNKQFKQTLLSVMKDWGDYAKSYLKAFLL